MKQNIQNWTSTFVSYLIHIYKNEYKGINYLKEPEEVMASTNQYKLQNDYYTEYCLDRLTITNDPKNKISRETLYSDFKAWCLKFYNVKIMTKKPECEKNFNKFLGQPDRIYYTKVLFNYNTESSGESDDCNGNNLLDQLDQTDQ